ncbi:hypothetical protein [Novosphingobium sp. PY1]|uniref:hypothetical protein n=1 Tax=Novosphingobium sp. PY1 TaxID=1882221 RepID=UPI001A8D6217|nr:hypothetical protein [Novosphingobium sp. PY1]
MPSDQPIQRTGKAANSRIKNKSSLQTTSNAQIISLQAQTIRFFDPSISLTGGIGFGADVIHHRKRLEFCDGSGGQTSKWFERWAGSGLCSPRQR